MTVDAEYRNTALVSGCENRFVPGPVAAPFFVVADAVQKLLLGNLPGHPPIEGFLIPRKDGLNSDGEIVVLGGQPANEIGRKDLALTKRVIVADPDQVGLVSCLYDVVQSTNSLENLEFKVKFLDIFATWGRIDFTNIALNAPNCLFFQRGNLLQPLLRVRHSELDLGHRILGS